MSVPVLPAPDPRRTVEVRWTCAYCGASDGGLVPDQDVGVAVGWMRASFCRHVLAEHPERAEDVA